MNRYEYTGNVKRHILAYIPTGVWSITNCISLYYWYLSDDECITAYWLTDIGCRKAHVNKIHYSTAGRPFIKKGDTRYYLDECMRV